jgi:hypothetical protein
MYHFSFPFVSMPAYPFSKILIISEMFSEVKIMFRVMSKFRVWISLLKEKRGLYYG